MNETKVLLGLMALGAVGVVFGSLGGGSVAYFQHLERMKALEVGAEVRKLDGKDYYVIPVEGANDNHIVTPAEKVENE